MFYTMKPEGLSMSKANAISPAASTAHSMLDRLQAPIESSGTVNEVMEVTPTENVPRPEVRSSTMLGKLEEGPRPNRRPRIAVCEYAVIRMSPIGSCLLTMLEQLCETIDFTVFAKEFENPRPDRIRFVKVPAPSRPMALLYLGFHAATIPIFYKMRWIDKMRFDLVQTTETYSMLGDVRYSQFCHSYYLKKHWKTSRSPGIYRISRWIDHWLRSMPEKLLYRRARAIVVPSLGLDRELRRECQLPTEQVTVITNPVDLARFSRPAEFDSGAFRKSLGMSSGEVVAAFVALGHFERKGLPFIFSAMQKTRDPHFKLLIVGGREGLIEEYRRQARQLGIDGSVIFAGMQKDVRPFFWSSDLFLFPSLYEAFSLVALQAAAASLPILAEHINGIEEFLEDGKNGFRIACSVEGVQQGLQRFLQLSSAERRNMGSLAQASVAEFSPENFARKWADFYRDHLPELSCLKPEVKSFEFPGQGVTEA